MATQAPAERLAASRASAPAVRLTGIRRTYGDVVAIARLDLDIAEGEFFTMLGPSGSGKTTTLRVIAGFERPDTGRVDALRAREAPELRIQVDGVGIDAEGAGRAGHLLR